MARRDLQDIGDYIARDSRPQAMRCVASLERFCQKLLTHTERYPLLERHAGRGIRRAPHGDCLIFYRVRGPLVEILRVSHAARNSDAITERL